MLAYDWIWRGQLTNQNLVQRCVEGCAEVYRGTWRCAEVCGGVQRCTRRCAEVCGGAQRCVEVRRGAGRCAEVFQTGGGGGKNQDFMLIRFLNAGIWLDVVGTINQSESCAEVHGGVQRGVRRCAEGFMEVQRGTRRCTEVHRGVHRGVQRGAQRCAEGCVEVRGGTQRCTEVHRGVQRFFNEVVGKKIRILC